MELGKMDKIRQKRDFGKALKYAAIRPVVLALYNFRYNSNIDLNLSQVLPTQVPPRGGCCIRGPTG
ncbi:hypothetical protein V1477_015043 [Vespula maculifrons]|uniref:Uncharacterized protein n=1 Tax=Vespula maculifrons TaxID=7453 RepID=A0ABD2BJ56_VESMC